MAQWGDGAATDSCTCTYLWFLRLVGCQPIVVCMVATTAAANPPPTLWQKSPAAGATFSGDQSGHHSSDSSRSWHSLWTVSGNREARQSSDRMWTAWLVPTYLITGMWRHRVIVERLRALWLVPRVIISRNSVIFLMRCCHVFSSTVSAVETPLLGLFARSLCFWVNSTPNIIGDDSESQTRDVRCALNFNLEAVAPYSSFSSSDGGAAGSGPPPVLEVTGPHFLT